MLLAKQLARRNDLSITEVALASGFASVRRFNETIRLLYDRPPTALRGSIARREPASGGEFKLRLPYKGPYDWETMIGDLARLSEPGRDGIAGGKYWRRLDLVGQVARLKVHCEPARSALALCLNLPVLSMLPPIIARVRRLFDLGANPGAIAAALGEDPHLAPLVAQRPGLRVVGPWDAIDGAEADLQAEARAHLAAYLGRPVSASEAATRWERWRPWQAYAARHLALAAAEHERTGNALHASVA